MKKIFSGIIIIALLFCLGGCQKNNDNHIPLKGEFQTGKDGISIETSSGDRIDIKTNGFKGDINGWNVDLGPKELQKLVETGENILKDQTEKTLKDVEIKTENINQELDKKLEETKKELNERIDKIDKELESIEKSLEELINSLKS